MAAETFGWSQLSDEQLQAMELAMAGHDVLAVLPTGAGQSAIYQVPALLDGPTLVVSPLIALQQDQLDGIAATQAPDAGCGELCTTQRRSKTGLAGRSTVAHAIRLPVMPG